MSPQEFERAMARAMALAWAEGYKTATDHSSDVLDHVFNKTPKPQPPVNPYIKESM